MSVHEAPYRQKSIQRASALPGNCRGHRLRALVLAFSILTALPQLCRGQDAPGLLPADLIAGETLSYTIDFWIFKHAAEGELCFAKTPGGYTALFEAETSGVLRVVAGHRKEIMESVMEWDRERQRLRPLRFRETLVENGRAVTTTVSFDYRQGAYTFTRVATGDRTQKITRPFPDAEFDDLLSFFYNFRMGCYGPRPAEGPVSAIMLMKMRPSAITINFSPGAAAKAGSKYNAAISMSRFLTQAQSKRILLRLTDEFIPEAACVVDALFFGDLVIMLKKPG